MTKLIRTAVNLPVADLSATIASYTALGFSFDPQFSDETAACMVINDSTTVMLLTREKFQDFSAAPIPDAKTSTGLMIALSFDSREAVDLFVSAGLTAGGSEPRPVMDMGFMYQRTISDPDGHRWEPFFIDMAQAPQG
jgi:uncharacterized protein